MSLGLLQFLKQQPRPNPWLPVSKPGTLHEGPSTARPQDCLGEPALGLGIPMTLLPSCPGLFPFRKSSLCSCLSLSQEQWLLSMIYKDTPQHVCYFANEVVPGSAKTKPGLEEKRQTLFFLLSQYHFIAITLTKNEADDGKTKQCQWLFHYKHPLTCSPPLIDLPARNGRGFTQRRTEFSEI